MEKRKHLAVALCVAIAAAGLAACPARANDAQTVQAAVDQAVARIGDELARTRFAGIANVAVLPLRDDADGYATGGLRAGVTRSHYKLFTRDDDEWRKLLSEIEWGVRREDVMDPNTVKKFGRISGVDALLFGRVWDSRTNMWSLRGQTKLTVYLAAVETGQVLWTSGPVQGEAYIHWSDALTQFWRYPLVIIGGLIALVIVWIVLRGIGRAIRRASRPL